jgi:hypothetical protein
MGLVIDHLNSKLKAEGETHATGDDRRDQGCLFTPQQKEQIIEKVTAAMVEVEGEGMRP